MIFADKKLTWYTNKKLKENINKSDKKQQKYQNKILENIKQKMLINWRITDKQIYLDNSKLREIMKNAVSVSTEPVKSLGELLSYGKELFGVADFMHCDVMDKSFVGRDLLGLHAIKKLNLNCGTMLDVHLMTKNLKNAYLDFVDAGANILTIHYESFKNKKNLVKTLKKIKNKFALAGISFVPQTDINEVLPFLKYCDVVLVMSVVPGKSGQNFLPETYQKVQVLDEYRKNNNLDFFIEVDGGIVPEIAKLLFEKGANMVVSGSYVYKSDDKKSAVQLLKKFQM